MFIVNIPITSKLKLKNKDKLNFYLVINVRLWLGFEVTMEDFFLICGIIFILVLWVGLFTDTAIWISLIGFLLRLAKEVIISDDLILYDFIIFNGRRSTVFFHGKHGKIIKQ